MLSSDNFRLCIGRQQTLIRIAASLVVIGAGAGLYFLGAQPFAVGLFRPPWDKLAHVTTFAAIGAAFAVASGTQGQRRAWCCIAGATVIGFMDEWHQVYLPGRSAGWDDLAADVTGGFLGAVLLSAASRGARRWLKHR